MGHSAVGNQQNALYGLERRQIDRLQTGGLLPLGYK
jgi:hypothetical protein